MFELFRNRVFKNGNTQKDIILNENQRNFEQYLESSPTSQIVKINDEEYKVIINDVSFNNENKDDKHLFAKLNTPINLGTYIEWNNENWLVIKDEKESMPIKISCRIRQCNNILTFQLPNGEIKEYPCIISDKTSVYSDGLDKNKYLILGDDQILVTIQNNSDTSQLKVNKRFIFNHDKNCIYELTKVQSLVQEGILYLTMTKSQKGANDRVDLNLADYVEINYSIRILNGNNLSLNSGDTLQLLCEVKNGDVVIENPTITYQSSDPLIASINSSGVITALQTGIVTITATSSGVSDSLIVTVEEVPVNNYSIEFVNPSTSIYQGQTKTYTIKVLNNGVEVTGKPVIWSISDTSLATITGSTDTTCIIKGSSSNLGYVTLRATLVDDINVFNEVQIQVKSII